MTFVLVIKRGVKKEEINNNNKRGNPPYSYQKDIRFRHIGSNLTLFVSAIIMEKRGRFTAMHKFQNEKLLSF